VHVNKSKMYPKHAAWYTLPEGMHSTLSAEMSDNICIVIQQTQMTV